MIYLIGLLYKDIDLNTWVLKQYFANSMDKEKELLENFISDISKFHKIITYNGDSFDLPFIDHRLSYYGIDKSIDRSKSYDLYRIIRNNKSYLDLKNLKLKTIEESLGYFREDIYSGFDCIGFYLDYINSKDQSLREKILRHNYDDLVHMLDILSILDVLDEKKSFYIESNTLSIKSNIDDIEIVGDMINIYGNFNIPLERDIIYYGSNYNVITKSLEKFHFSIEFKEGYITKEDKCIYIDLLDFPSFNLQNSKDYNLPGNIFILIIEKKYLINNIKSLLTLVFQNLIIN